MAIPLPEKYWKLAGAEVFDHDSRTLSKVMQSGFFEPSKEYFIYREAFMRLFEYLEQIFQFIVMGLIQTNDVKRVKWVLEGIASPNFIENSILLGHLQSHFQDVVRLMLIMGIDSSDNEENAGKQSSTHL